MKNMFTSYISVLWKNTLSRAIKKWQGVSVSYVLAEIRTYLRKQRIASNHRCTKSQSKKYFKEFIKRPARISNSFHLLDMGPPSWYKKCGEKSTKTSNTKSLQLWTGVQAKQNSSRLGPKETETCMYGQYCKKGINWTLNILIAINMKIGDLK